MCGCLLTSETGRPPFKPFSKAGSAGAVDMLSGKQFAPVIKNMILQNGKIIKDNPREIELLFLLSQ